MENQQKIDENRQTLTELLESMKDHKWGPFRPYYRLDEEHGLFQVYFKGDPDYSESIAPGISVMRNMDTNEIIGVTVMGLPRNEDQESETHNLDQANSGNDLPPKSNVTAFGMKTELGKRMKGLFESVSQDYDTDHVVAALFELTKYMEHMLNSVDNHFDDLDLQRTDGDD